MTPIYILNYLPTVMFRGTPCSCLYIYLKKYFQINKFSLISLEFSLQKDL